MSDTQYLTISVLMANVSKKIEQLPPTDFRDELRILTHNMFEVLDRYNDSKEANANANATES
jgi:hypothetical protein